MVLLEHVSAERVPKPVFGRQVAGHERGSFTLKIMVGVLLERYSMIKEFFHYSNTGMIVFLNHGMIREFSTNSNVGMIVFLKPRHDQGVSHNSSMGMIVVFRRHVQFEDEHDNHEGELERGQLFPQHVVDQVSILGRPPSFLMSNRLG